MHPGQEDSALSAFPMPLIGPDTDRGGDFYRPVGNRPAARVECLQPAWTSRSRMRIERQQLANCGYPGQSIRRVTTGARPSQGRVHEDLSRAHVAGCPVHHFRRDCCRCFPWPRSAPRSTRRACSVWGSRAWPGVWRRLSGRAASGSPTPRSEGLNRWTLVSTNQVAESSMARLRKYSVVPQQRQRATGFLHRDGLEMPGIARIISTRWS